MTEEPNTSATGASRGGLATIEPDGLPIGLDRLHCVETVAVRTGSGSGLAPSGRPDGERGPDRDWAWLWWPTALGAVASALVAVAGSLPGSPFKLATAGGWFFGESSASAPAHGSGMLVASFLGFAGVIVMIRIWLYLVQALCCPAHQSLPARPGRSRLSVRRPRRRSLVPGTDTLWPLVRHACRARNHDCRA